MTSRHRVLLTTALSAGFLLTLTGTSKPEEKKDPDADKKASSDPVATAPEEPQSEEPAKPAPVVIPSTEGWTKTEIEGAKLVVMLPPGATLERGGLDASFAGRYFAVKLATGYELSFVQNGGAPVDLPEKTKWYETNANGFEGFILQAEDALVAARSEAEPVGKYWESTVCSAAVEGGRLCMESAGASIDMDGKVTKLSNEEVLATIALARSIEALP